MEHAFGAEEGVLNDHDLVGPGGDVDLEPPDGCHLPAREGDPDGVGDPEVSVPVDRLGAESGRADVERRPTRLDRVGRGPARGRRRPDDAGHECKIQFSRCSGSSGTATRRVGATGGGGTA